MTRWLMILCMLFAASCNAITGADGIDLRDGETTSDAAGKKRAGDSPLLSLLAGANGSITTLATYPNGNPHPGTNAIDIGAPGGTAVWHQVDYLDAHIAGGWIYVEQVHEAGLCSQWTPGSSYYNGAKLLVFTYFYDAQGGYLGWHRAAFQHVEPDAPNAWWTWNNASAAQPLWPSAQLQLGNQTSGGLYLGTVFAGGNRSLTNGAGGKLCHQGDHLHQEGDGNRASQRYRGEAVTARYHDLHYFLPATGYPTPGAPPSAPTSDPGTPPDPGGEPPPTDACNGIDYYGRCDSGVLSWCEAGAVQTYDCAMVGMGCGWESSAIGYNCLYGCGDLDYIGACLGPSLRWCEGDQIKVYDCASIGLSCAYQDDAIGYNCL